MSTNVVNTVPYLRTSRDFPKDLEKLSIEVNKCYIDIANAVNNRTISIFPTNKPAVGGESWFLSNNQKQQNLRQIYQFTSAGNIPHGINTTFIDRFTKCQGSYTNGTNFFGVIFASSVAIAGQVTFYITPTNIVVLSGAGAPAIDPVKGGIIVLEWLSVP